MNQRVDFNDLDLDVLYKALKDHKDKCEKKLLEVIGKPCDYVTTRCADDFKHAVELLQKTKGEWTWTITRK